MSSHSLIRRPAAGADLREPAQQVPGALRRTVTRLTLALLLSLSCSALAMEPRDFSSDEEEARFTELTEELRCTVCQNQSLADSDAQLARDLRDEVYTMLQQGNTNEEIKTFLVDRYGDFVLYRPPVRGNTLLLWLAPLLLLTTGAAVMAMTISRRRTMLAEEALEEAGDETADGEIAGDESAGDESADDEIADDDGEATDQDASSREHPDDSDPGDDHGAPRP